MKTSRNKWMNKKKQRTHLGFNAHPYSDSKLYEPTKAREKEGKTGTSHIVLFLR